MFIQPQKDNLNLENSVLEPTQSITFLGFQIDSISMKLLVPKEKKKSVIKEIRNFLKLDCCSPRKLAGLKGKLVSLQSSHSDFTLVEQTSFTLSVSLSPKEVGINHSSRCQVRDFTLFNSSKPMEWKGNQSISELRLCSLLQNQVQVPLSRKETRQSKLGHSSC
ncbi:hypothetical protein ACTFIR_009362 [Dictyostelium discoideum]